MKKLRIEKDGGGKMVVWRWLGNLIKQKLYDANLSIDSVEFVYAMVEEIFKF